MKTFRYRLTQNNEYHALFDQVAECRKNGGVFTVRERRYARKIATGRRLSNIGVVPGFRPDEMPIAANRHVVSRRCPRMDKSSFEDLSLPWPTLLRLHEDRQVPMRARCDP
jgi:hypothetical protein